MILSSYLLAVVFWEGALLDATVLLAGLDAWELLEAAGLLVGLDAWALLDEAGLLAGLDAWALLDEAGLLVGFDAWALLDEADLLVGFDAWALFDEAGLLAGLDAWALLEAVVLLAGFCADELLPDDWLEDLFCAVCGLDEVFVFWEGLEELACWDGLEELFEEVDDAEDLLAVSLDEGVYLVMFIEAIFFPSVKLELILKDSDVERPSLCTMVRLAVKSIRYSWWLLSSFLVIL